MKKEILFCLLFLLALTVPVKAEPSIIFEEGGIGISIDQNTLTLNDYSYSDNGVYEGAYAIYTSGDLTINLNGTSNITNSCIYVGGRLTITGDGILNVKTLELNNLKIESGTINISDPSNSVFNERPDFPFYASYLNETEKGCFCDEIEGIFLDYVTWDVVDNLTLSKYQLADINNLNITNPVYWFNPLEEENNEMENVDGFIIFEPNDLISVEYDNIDTYTVDMWNLGSDVGYERGFIEFLFNDSEFGKLVEFEVLEATNFYYNKNSVKTKLNVGDVIKEQYEYVGGTGYSKENDSEYELGSIYLNLFALDNNYISLKMLGANGSYKYINLKVKEKPTPKPQEEEKKEYVIPNTGIK